MDRLEGLDLARFFALIGMIMVNFDVVMVNPILVIDSGIGHWLQGKAAALFVVLAGIGFGLAAKDKPWLNTFHLTLKRFVFLLALGLLNALIFPADIIHYYAFYFLFAMLLLPLSNRYLVFIIAGLMGGFVIMALVFNYDEGWNWTDHHYQGFWTFEGFIRNLFFNGWHPIFPWLGFLMTGVLLSRIDLRSKVIQLKMLAFGTLLFLVVSWVSQQLMACAEITDPEAAVLFGTEPIPPMPMYVLAAGSFAVAVVGGCLLFEPWLRSWNLLGLITPVGKQTLTWYIAHIVLGMGLLESTGRIANQTPNQALYAACLFGLSATLIACLWSTRFKRGPVEALMRKITG